MKNFGIAAAVILLLGVAAFIIWKMMAEKKASQQKTTVAAAEANTNAMLAVQEMMTGIDLSDSVRKSNSQFGRY